MPPPNVPVYFELKSSETQGVAGKTFTSPLTPQKNLDRAPGPESEISSAVTLSERLTYMAGQTSGYPTSALLIVLRLTLLLVGAPGASPIP